MTRWARFQAAGGRIGFGAIDELGITEYHGNPFERPTRTVATLPNGAFTLLSPCMPSKIIALWNNFHALGAKLGKAPPSHPLFLIEPASSVAGPGEPVRRPLAYKGKIAFEGELGIVIGRRRAPELSAVRHDLLADGAGKPRMSVYDRFMAGTASAPGRIAHAVVGG
jgi:2-keto-4-pentenoate hydratase/2-oxohepta-3-ene-1,7-dioic acid hydratase in catechol pathway